MICINPHKAIKTALGALFFALVCVLPSQTVSANTLVSGISADITGSSGSVQTIGSFVATTTFATGTPLYITATYENLSGIPSCATSNFIAISTASTSNNGTFSVQAIASTTVSGTQPLSAFRGLAKALNASTTYFVRAHTQCSGGHYSLSNLEFNAGFNGTTTTFCGDDVATGPSTKRTCYLKTDHTSVFLSQFRYFNGTYPDESNPVGNGSVNTTIVGFVYPFTGATTTYWAKSVSVDTTWGIQITTTDGGTTWLPASTSTVATTTATTTATTKYIQILSPAYGSTTATSTNISVRFKTPLSIDHRPTTTRTVVIKDAISLIEEQRFEDVLPDGSGEDVLQNYPVTLTNGSKFVFAYYANTDGSPYSEVAQLFFNVNVNSYEIATGLSTPTSTPTETQNDCTLFDIGCQFQKAIMFLFYPSADILDRFSTLWRNVSTKAPFGYVTVTIDALGSLDTNGAHTFDLGEVPFQEAIFDPLRIAMGSILWGIYAIFFYHRRLKTLDI